MNPKRSWAGLARAVIGPVLAVLGCGAAQAEGLLSPASLTAASQRDLMIWAFVLMLVVLIPVWLMAIWFPWRYREGNRSAEYRPEWAHSPLVETVVWLVPAILVLAIGALVWIGTHRLDPYRPVVGEGAPLQVQVISLDWKWVFLYPEQGVATVNTLVLPEGRPVDLALTSDTVMSSLYIPGLAGQIYAMAGMVTHLNVAPMRTGQFVGRNMQYSGKGFADHHFSVVVESPARFRERLTQVRAQAPRLSLTDYQRLAEARAVAPEQRYAAFPPGLFQTVVRKYCATDCDVEPAAEVP